MVSTIIKYKIGERDTSNCGLNEVIDMTKMKPEIRDKLEKEHLYCSVVEQNGSSIIVSMSSQGSLQPI